MPLTREMRIEYETKFATCTTKPEFQDDTEATIARVMRHKDRYSAVSSKTKVPWHVIAVIHNLECGGRFDCHLHNGDPLRRRTVNVPAGRPLKGKAPFTWEASAIDALAFDGFTKWSDWSVAGTLYKLEAYNGLGYRKRGVPSPYLWSGSQHYSKGKYVSDGRFDPKAVSTQVGAGPLLRRMDDEGLISIGADPALAEPLQLSGLESDRSCTDTR